jgi:uridine kinase
MAACRIYLEERDPRRRASIVVDNTDPGRPLVERLPARA